MKNFIENIRHSYFSIISVIFLILSGCATPYQKLGLRGGYSEMQFNQTTYQISFRGNGYTSASKVKKYVLYRAAELAHNADYPFFIVLHSETNKKKSSYSTPTTVSSSGYYSGNSYTNATASLYKDYAYIDGNTMSSGFYNKNTYITPGKTYTINKFEQVTIVRFLENNKNYPGAFNAELILKNMDN